MATDIRLANEVREGAPPAFRLYRWSPRAVSVGRHQDESVFDRELLRTHGIDLVRRPTGGRAILHANEVTYAVAVRCAGPGLRDIYRMINEGLLAGLRLLGIDAVLAGRSDDFRSQLPAPEYLPCFSSTAKCELLWNGRKVAGSAQRRYGDTVLQHGSLPLDGSHLEITSYLAPHLAGRAEGIEEQLESHAVDIGTILGRQVSYEEAAAALRRGCAETWNAEFVDEEAALAHA